MMTYYLTPTILEKIKNTDNTFWQKCEGFKTSNIGGGISNDASTFKESSAVSQKFKQI